MYYVDTVDARLPLFHTIITGIKIFSSRTWW